MKSAVGVSTKERDQLFAEKHEDQREPDLDVLRCTCMPRNDPTVVCIVFVIKISVFSLRVT